MKLQILLFIAFLFSGCIVDQGKISVAIKKKSPATEASKTLQNTSISSVRVINNQLVINGSGLDVVSDVKIDGQSFNEKFSIVNKSATQIIANSLHSFSFDVSKVFNLILSDAQASTSFQIDFALCNATLNNKGFDCSSSIVLHHNDVLSYDSGTQKWKPRAINNLSYMGLLDASAALPAAGPAGQYYIVSVPGNGFSEGDWAVSNGVSFDQINNATYVTKVFGRTGDVEPEAGDYSLEMLSDVNVNPSVADDGKVLKYDSATSKWILGTDNSGGGASSVNTTSIVNGAVTDAKIDSISASKITGTITSSQIADGTIVNADISATAAIALSKINIPDASIPVAKINGLTAATSVLTTTISDNDSTHAPDGNAVFEALGLKMNLAGGALSVGGTITGLPALPMAGSEATSKDYVDSLVRWEVDGVDIFRSTGNVGIGLADPAYSLDVAGDVNVTGNFKINGININTAGGLSGSGTTNYVSKFNGSAIADSQIIDNGSTVGIGLVPDAFNVNANSKLRTTGMQLGNSVTMYNQGHSIKHAPNVDGSTFTTATADAFTVVGGYAFINRNESWMGGGFSEAAAQILRFFTSPTFNNATGVERMQISANGNVGIGVDGPTNKLEVAGTVKSTTGGFIFPDGSTQTTAATSFTGSGSRAIVTSAGGALMTSATTADELGYLSGVSSSIQTQLDAKESTVAAGTTSQYFRGDKSWQTLDTSVVTEGSRLYFTEDRVRATPLTGATSATGAIVPGDSLLSAFGKLMNTQSDYVSKTANSTITGTLTINSIVGALTVPDPINPNDAVNRKYVDSYGLWTKDGANNIRRATGNVGIGTTTPDSLLTISSNTSGTPLLTGYAGTMLHIIGTDGVKSRLMIDGIGTSSPPIYSMRAARGTAGALSAVQIGDELGEIGGSGYATTGYASGGKSRVLFYAGENWTDSTTASYMTFETTPMGSTTQDERMRIDSAGNVGIGTTNPTEKLSVAGIIESTVGGFKFPNGSVQTNAAAIMLAASATSTVGPMVTTYATFAGSGFNTSEAYKGLPLPQGGTLSKFYLRLGSAQAATGNLVVTVRINGVDTGIQVTIPAGGAIGTYSDTTNSATVSAGDIVTISFVNSTTAGASGTIAGYSIMLQ